MSDSIVRFKFVGKSFYFLDNGEQFYIHYDKESKNQFIVKQGIRNMIDLNLIYCDKNNGEPPIRFTYEGDKIIVDISDFANFYARPKMQEPISSGEKVSLTIDKDDDVIVDIIETKGYNGPKQRIKFELIKLDGSQEEEIPDRFMNTYNRKTEIESNKYEDTDELARMEYILSRELEAECIGTGAYRRAYNVSGLDPSFLDESDGDIIKLAKEAEENQGIKANRKEIQTYQAIKGTEIEKFFCPITGIGPNHKYIVMKEADVNNNNIHKVSKNYTNIDDEHESYVELIKDILQTAIIHQNRDVRDIRDDNVGELNGRNVIIDYQFGGNFHIDAGRLYGEPNVDEKEQEEIEEKLNNFI